MSIVVVWSRNQVLDTTHFVNTLAPLAGDPVLQVDIANRITAVIVEQSDINDRYDWALPNKLSFLTDNVETNFQSFVYKADLAFIVSAAFEVAWRESTRVTHVAIKQVLTNTGSGGKISAGVIDVGPVVRSVVSTLVEKGATFLKDAPVESWDLSFQLFDPSGLQRLQGAVSLLNQLGVVLPVVSVVAAASVILVARPRRRGVFLVAIATALAGLGVVGLLWLVRRIYEDSLDPVDDVFAARAFNIVTRGLGGTGKTFLLIAACVIIGVAIGTSRKGVSHDGK